MKKILTLCIVKNEDKILLGMKKRGFGVGHWNGFGGKLEESESVENGAKRELKEEAGIEVDTLDKVGILEFEFENDSKILEVHIFLIKYFSGEPQETNEMVPKWFDINEIPFNDMWDDDQYWFPLLLSGKKFKGYFMFDKPSSFEYKAKIIKQELKEVDNL